MTEIATLIIGFACGFGLCAVLSTSSRHRTPAEDDEQASVLSQAVDHYGEQAKRFAAQSKRTPVKCFCKKCGWAGWTFAVEPSGIYQHPGCAYSAVPLEHLAATRKQQPS